jgi:hypothetical protein
MRKAKSRSMLPKQLSSSASDRAARPSRIRKAEEHRSYDGKDSRDRPQEAYAYRHPSAAFIGAQARLRSRGLRLRGQHVQFALRPAGQVLRPERYEQERRSMALHPNFLRFPYIFENEWQSFCIRLNRDLELTTAPHTYDRPGRYKVAIKVIDIFGRHTMTLELVNVGQRTREKTLVKPVFRCEDVPAACGE